VQVFLLAAMKKLRKNKTVLNKIKLIGHKFNKISKIL